MKKLLKQALAFGMAAAFLATSAFAAAKYGKVDPNAPYKPPVSGMFHEQKLDADGVSGQYSVYIPSSFEPCTDGVMVLVPNGSTAKGFAEGDGKGWVTLSDKLGIAAVFVEPQGGKDWNLAYSADARDDGAFIKKVYDTIRNKARSIDAAFDLDERAFYLVGYGSGGTAAHEAAMAWPAIFCGVASVGGSNVPADVMAKLGDAYSYPFAQADSLAGRDENKLPNKDVPVPVWIIESPEADANSTAVEAYWVAANGAAAGKGNTYAQRTYANKDNGRQRVWVTTGENISKVSVETLYTEFLAKVQRFVGDPGGRLEWTVDHTEKNGFYVTEAKVDGFTRRWMTFVPSSYKKGTAVPLVLAMHGYSSANTAFTGDTRWQEVAEKNGFIVVFAQAYPVDGGYGENIPVPYWNNYSGPAYEGTPDDISFLRQLIAATEKDYSIDASRVYATGHSNGSGETWALALDAPGLFAAVAPVGLTMGSYKDGAGDLDVPLPVWTFKGQYDIDNADVFEAGNTNDLCLKQWTPRNGLDLASKKQASDSTGRYVTTTYTNGKDDAPLFKFTTVKNSPHAYLPAEAEMIWDDFFSKYTLGADGKRYYDGKEISRAAETEAPAENSFTDITNHWAKDSILKAVGAGLFTGTSATAFSPEDPVTRGMAVTVLGRMAKADASAKAAFADVPADAYYNGYIAWAVKEGIAKGTSATTFEPEANVTREQLAVMLHGYLKDKPVDGGMAIKEYKDYGQISSWAAEAMDYCYNAKLITGKTADTLDPQGLLTRAELATILMRVGA
ncbi:S-layer homology domain-containing protein [Intestinibacillus massiliensis]|nr:S-layer homology domain-containing protein [Intestinibacillus massiliensis]